MQDIAQLAADDLEPGLGVLSVLPKHSRAFLLLDHRGGRQLATSSTGWITLRAPSQRVCPPTIACSNTCQWPPPRVAAQLISLLIKPTVVTEWICKPSLMSLAQHQNKPGLAKLMLGPNTMYLDLMGWPLAMESPRRR